MRSAAAGCQRKTRAADPHAFAARRWRSRVSRKSPSRTHRREQAPRLNLPPIAPTPTSKSPVGIASRLAFETCRRYRNNSRMGNGPDRTEGYVHTRIFVPRSNRPTPLAGGGVLSCAPLSYQQIAVRETGALRFVLFLLRARRSSSVPLRCKALPPCGATSHRNPRRSSRHPDSLHPPSLWPIPIGRQGAWRVAFCDADAEEGSGDTPDLHFQGKIRTPSLCWRHQAQRCWKPRQQSKARCGRRCHAFREAARSYSPSLRQEDLARRCTIRAFRPANRILTFQSVQRAGGAGSGVSTTSISSVLGSWRSLLLLRGGAQSS